VPVAAPCCAGAAMLRTMSSVEIGALEAEAGVEDVREQLLFCLSSKYMFNPSILSAFHSKSSLFAKDVVSN
jgi:hypothetical protein